MVELTTQAGCSKCRNASCVCGPTASDVREKDRKAAEKYAYESIESHAYTPRWVQNAFLAGIQHARSEQEGLVSALQMLLKEEQPSGYHDCVDNGLPICAWCAAEEALAGWRKSK